MIAGASRRRRRQTLTRAALALALLLSAWPSLAGAQSQPPPGTDAAGAATPATGFVLGLPAGEPLAGEALDQATEEVGREIRCPVCQGLSIADSPVDTAIAMKTEVREMLAEGYTADQVFATFEASYGEFVRLRPKAEGFNLVVWIAPVVGLLIGLGLVIHRLRSAHVEARVAEAPDAPPEGDSAVELEDPELTAYLDQVRREVGS